jgi:signal transduction histidine kinase/ligand-binding sensor domain-containing protein/DNA-binding response OmpR family regulator
MKTVKFLLFNLFFINVLSFGQENFRFEHLTVNDGLAHSDAVAVLQDPKGFIWIGTNNGIDRYDGYELKNYVLPNDNSSGIYNNRITSLYQGRSGRIWATADEQSVYFYDPIRDAFRPLSDLLTDDNDKKLLKEISARTVLEHPNGEIYIGTRYHGLLKVKKTIQTYPFTKAGSPVAVFKLEIDEKGTLWIGTTGLGLWKLEPKDKTPQRFTAWTQNNVRALYVQKGSTLWIGSDHQVARLNQNLTFLNGSFASVNCIYEDSYKRMWIGTNFGLHLVTKLKQITPDLLDFSDQVFSVDPDNPWAINSNRVHQVCEDSFKNLWFAASSGGLNKISLLAKPFGLINKLSHKDMPDNYINTLWPDHQYIWIGTRNGMARYHTLTGEFRSVLHNNVSASTTHISVSSIYDPGNNELWISSRENGIYILNKSTFALKRLPEIEGLRPWSQIEPLCIREDGKGQIWIATFYAGIYIFDKSGKFIQVLTPDNSPLPTDKITSLLYDAQEDVMWASTRNAGVCKLKWGTQGLELLQHFQFEAGKENSLKVNYSWPLLKDKKGRIWVGTLGGGLHMIDNVNTIHRYDKYLPESNVETIVEADNGELWIGGRGLYKFDPETKTYLHFDVADGLQSNSFKIGAACKSPDGKLYFGGINGISHFYPHLISRNPYPPKMQITGLRIVTYEDQNHPRAHMSGSGKITLSDKENDFAISFVGLNFQNPRKQRYAYKLEGYHENWIPLPPGQRIAAFAGLPAGEYTFKVKADNGDGIWSEEDATLNIKILPPWYKTTLAYISYAVIIFLVLSWYRRVRAKQRELQNKVTLEQMEKQKERELSEMKLNFFTNVSHELRTPLSLILHPADDLVKAVEPGSEAHGKAVLVHKQANKLLTLVNQLMDLRKVESGNMPIHLEKVDVISFIREIFLIFKIKAEEKNIQYEFLSEHTELVADFDIAKLEIILTNLLSNAFKYTQSGGQIQLSVSNTGNQSLLLTFKDSGIGIHPQDIKNIFEPFYQSVNRSKIPGTGIGLSLVKELVQMLGGEIQVESTLGEGSTFVVKLPLQNSQNISYKQDKEDLPSFLPDREAKIDAHLLIVEDNADLRNYLEEIFGSTLKVSMATNGKEAWEMIRNDTPDAVLSDVMMPEMDGLELCSKVKNHPKFAHLPIVLITARAAAVHELEGIESGADDYIVKPFNPKILFSKVTALLQNRKKLRELFQRQLVTEPKETELEDADLNFLREAMSIIEDNLTNKQFGVQSLVQSSGMSQSAYYRKLKNLTGQSVVEFIRDVRMKKAAQLLTTGKFRITEVMEQVGIEDYKYFRTAFQKLYHVSPSEFAKNHVKSNV